MIFELTDEARMLVDTVSRFVRERLKPLEAEVDLADGMAPDRMQALRKEACALGLYGYNMPESIGGPGLPILTLAALDEAIGHTSMPLGEVPQAMQSGAIDAIEFVGPLNDLSYGLHKVAKFYYWPGWLEPSGPYDIMINPKAWATLSVTEQEIVKAGAAVAMKANIDEMWAKNATAYNQLTGELKVQVRQIPDDTIRLIADQAYKVCEAEAGKDADSKEVWASVMKFRKDILPYMKVSEYDFMRIRELVKFG